MACCVCVQSKLSVFCGLLLVTNSICSRIEWYSLQTLPVNINANYWPFEKLHQTLHTVFYLAIQKTPSNLVWQNSAGYRFLIHLLIFGYQMKHSLTLFTSRCLKTNETLVNMFDITLLSVWKTDETLVNVFDITLLSVWKTDKTLVNVCDVSLHGVW